MNIKNFKKFWALVVKEVKEQTMKIGILKSIDTMALLYRTSVDLYYSLMLKHHKVVGKIIEVWILQINIALDQTKVLIADNPELESDLKDAADKLSGIHSGLDKAFDYLKPSK